MARRTASGGGMDSGGRHEGRWDGTGQVFKRSFRGDTIKAGSLCASSPFYPHIYQHSVGPVVLAPPQGLNLC